MESTNECNSWRCYLHSSSRRNVNLGMESLEKKLMKKLLSLLVIGLLLTGCASKPIEQNNSRTPDVKFRCATDCLGRDRGVSP